VGLLREDHIKTPGGKYRYPESEIKRLFGEKACARCVGKSWARMGTGE